MNEIICPNCKKAFQVDEAGFADILRQVRDEQFDNELHARLADADKAKATELELAKAKAATEFQKQTAKRDQEISELRSKLELSDAEKKLAIKEALVVVEKQRDDLKRDLEIKKAEDQANKAALELEHKYALDIANKEIELLRNMKKALSTKMVGETLEQHCENEFNSLRSAAFPNAYFEKDNTNSKSGSKGDYIFRDFDSEGTEIVSIMFEMKNESEETAKKSKNEVFLKELDKDRQEKKCEYAVLVSLLEQDNELYNNGIVDMSHKYPKMYVVRPQFFIPIITLLRNANSNSLAVKAELARVKEQNIDITNFEVKLQEFKGKVSNNYRLATERFNKAIAEIDDSIKALEATKQFLKESAASFGRAETAADKLTIKALTTNNPTMKGKFKELE